MSRTEYYGDGEGNNFGYLWESITSGGEKK